jgi:hypothetical protein
VPRVSAAVSLSTAARDLITAKRGLVLVGWAGRVLRDSAVVRGGIVGREWIFVVSGLVSVFRWGEEG